MTVAPAASPDYDVPERHVSEVVPVVRGDGPLTCSTETALSVVPAYIFDVNGYYRDLGVDPRASIKEIREAYFERDGMNSERLTYIVKQLRNPAIRHEYDRLTLGEIYVDKYVQEELHRRTLDKARERMMRDGHDLLDMDTVNVYQRGVYEDLGVLLEDDAEELDDIRRAALDVLAGKSQTDPARPAKFEYSFYVVGSPYWDKIEQRLAEWQEHLVKALARRGVRTQFAVGVFDRPTRSWALAQVGNCEVFLLHHLETPTADLAERLATAWYRTHKQNHPSRTER